MKKMKMWKRMLAFLLAFTLIIQSSVSVGAVTDDETNTEGTTQTQQEAESASAAIAAKVVQELLVKGTGDEKQNYVKYTVTMQNKSSEAAAENVEVKALLPDLITYAMEPGETANLSVFENQNKLAEGLDLNEVNKETLHKYEAGQVLMWNNITLAPEAKQQLVVYGSVELGAKDVQDLASVWYVAGNEAATTWENASALIVDPVAVAKRNQSSTTATTENASDTEATTEEQKDTTTATSATTEAENSNENTLKNTVTKVARAFASFFNAGNSSNTVTPLDDDDDPVNETTSNKLSDYITNITFQADTDGKEIYDADNPAMNNGWFFLRFDFAENETYQFPVYDKDDPENTTLTIQIPEEIKGYDEVGPTNIVKTGTTEVFGIYEISKEGLISIKFNNKVQTYSNCNSFLMFQAQFDRTKVPVDDEYSIDFEGNVDVNIKFKNGGKLTGKKTASAYDSATGTFTFTITIIAEDELKNVRVDDTMGENLILLENSVKLNGETVEITKNTDGTNGFHVIFPTLEQGTYTLTYQASIDREAMLSYNGTQIPGLTNSADLNADGETTVPIQGDAEFSHQWLEKVTMVLTLIQKRLHGRLHYILLD